MPAATALSPTLPTARILSPRIDGQYRYFNQLDNSQSHHDRLLHPAQGRGRAGTAANGTAGSQIYYDASKSCIFAKIFHAAALLS